MVTPSGKYKLAVVLLALWLVAIAGAFWWFQFRNISAYSEYWASFDGQHLLDQIVAVPEGKPLVLHFVDPQCPCSRFSVPHIAELETRYQNQVKFVDVHTAKHYKAAATDALPLRSVPAGPAVAIWDRNGRLAYFGPYSGGAVCGQGTDFVAATLAALAIGKNPQWINHEAVGCFCPWVS